MFRRFKNCNLVHLAHLQSVQSHTDLRYLVIRQIKWSAAVGSFSKLCYIWYFLTSIFWPSWPTASFNHPDWTTPGSKRAGIRAMLIYLGLNTAPVSYPAAGKGNGHMGTMGNQRLLCPHLYRDLSMSHINLLHTADGGLSRQSTGLQLDNESWTLCL